MLSTQSSILTSRRGLVSEGPGLETGPQGRSTEKKIDEHLNEKGASVLLLLFHPPRFPTTPFSPLSLALRLALPLLAAPPPFAGSQDG